MGIYLKQWGLAVITETYNKLTGTWVQSAPKHLTAFPPMTKPEAESWALDLSQIEVEGQLAAVVVFNLNSI